MDTAEDDAHASTALEASRTMRSPMSSPRSTRCRRGHLQPTHRRRLRGGTQGHAKEERAIHQACNRAKSGALRRSSRMLGEGWGASAPGRACGLLAHSTACFGREGASKLTDETGGEGSENLHLAWQAGRACLCAVRTRTRLAMLLRVEGGGSCTLRRESPKSQEGEKARKRESEKAR